MKRKSFAFKVIDKDNGVGVISINFNNTAMKSTELGNELSKVEIKYLEKSIQGLYDSDYTKVEYIPE